MTIKDAAPMLKEMIGLIHERIAEAAEAATAAKACASVNNLDEAIRITLAIEQPLYEANTLMNAASLIKRLSNDD